MSCASGTPAPNMTPADMAHQYTVIEEGSRNGFCVAGTTMNQAYDVEFGYVRAFLKAHAEPCIPAACAEPRNLLKGEVSGWWHAMQYGLDHPLAPCP